MRIQYRKYALPLISLVLFTLIGCTNNEQKNDKNETYTFEVSKKRGDIIEKNNEVYNTEKLDTFVKTIIQIKTIPLELLNLIPRTSQLLLI
ncbi:hypothetical protein BC30048_5001 [Bacillus cereus]|nr:hypothetical protein BC30048_5001 [Bacillus cereus]